MKKIILISLLLVISVMARVEIFPDTASETLQGKPACPLFDAGSVLLIDLTNERTLYEMNENESLRIASLTKIMTGILIIERINLSTFAKVSSNVRKIKTWKLGLKPGQRIRMRYLLYTILLESRNDAVLVAAEAIGGTEKNFVKLMNEKAKKIGAIHTKFTNSHGLDTYGGNFSTASDLAKIACYALKNPLFAQIVRTEEKDVYWKGSSTHHKKLKNVNKTLFSYEGADGVKTGYTKRAGKCIVATATRNRRKLLCIILNTKNIWKNTSKMLDYGFSN